jgi:hypothetical protein
MNNRNLIPDPSAGLDAATLKSMPYPVHLRRRYADLWFIPFRLMTLGCHRRKMSVRPLPEPLRRLLDDLLKVRKTEFSVAIDTRPGPRLVFKGGCYR